MSPRVYCLSTLDLDRIYRVAHLPGRDEKILASAYEEMPGGQGLYVARALAALGAEVTFVGAVGDDATGRMLVDRLAGIPNLTPAIALVEGERTGSCAIFVLPDGEKALVLAPISERLIERLGAGLTVSRGDFVTANLFHPRNQKALFSRARAAGGRVVLDLEINAVTRWGWTEALDLLSEVDVVCANRIVLEAWWAREGGGGTPMDGAERFAAALAGPRQRSVCVTLGAEGVLLMHAGHVEHIPAVPVRMVNATGAGDTFLAGLVFALLSGRPMPEAVRFGCAAAARFVSGEALSPLSDWQSC